MARQFDKFAAAVRKRLGPGGEVLIDFAVNLMDGNIDGARAKDRLDAMKWLAETGYGKRPKEVEVSGGVDMNLVLPPMDLKQLSDEDLKVIDEKLSATLLPAPVEVEDAEFTEVEAE